MIMMAQSNPAGDFNSSSSDGNSSDQDTLSNAGTVASTDSTQSVLSSEHDLVDELADAMRDARLHREQRDQL